MSRRLVLASASPARHRLLVAAGFDPEVLISGVREEGIEAPDTATLVATLAGLKATSVAAQVSDALVIGCDSLLDLDGRAIGKPASPAEAVEICRMQRGRTGSLMTGQCVLDTATGRAATGVSRTLVRFGHPSDAEIDAYISTGEPLRVAGAFTLDGYSGPFIDGIEGDPSTVIGLSLSLFRNQLAELGVEMTDLWR